MSSTWWHLGFRGRATGKETSESKNDKRRQYDETLSATGGCTTANDVVILQTVPVPKVSGSTFPYTTWTMTMIHHRFRQPSLLFSTDHSPIWWKVHSQCSSNFSFSGFVGPETSLPMGLNSMDVAGACLLNAVLTKNIPTSVQVMAWRRTGDNTLSEPMMVRLLTHICVARPQWVKEHTFYVCPHSCGPYIISGLDTDLFVHKISHTAVFPSPITILSK